MCQNVCNLTSNSVQNAGKSIDPIMVAGDKVPWKFWLQNRLAFSCVFSGSYWKFCLISKRYWIVLCNGIKLQYFCSNSLCCVKENSTFIQKLFMYTTAKKKKNQVSLLHYHVNSISFLWGGHFHKSMMGVTTLLPSKQLQFLGTQFLKELNR